MTDRYPGEAVMCDWPCFNAGWIKRSSHGLSGKGKMMDGNPVIAELVNLGWSVKTLAVWHRAKCRCEYCGEDLLASADAYLYGSQVDHVVPGGGDGLANLALACKACNFIKRDRNFAPAMGVAANRAEIVEKAKAFIELRRNENCRRLQRVKELVALISPAHDFQSAASDQSLQAS